MFPSNRGSSSRTKSRVFCFQLSNDPSPKQFGFRVQKLWSTKEARTNFSIADDSKVTTYALTSSSYFCCFHQQLSKNAPHALPAVVFREEIGFFGNPGHFSTTISDFFGVATIWKAMLDDFGFLMIPGLDVCYFPGLPLRSLSTCCK